MVFAKKVLPNEVDSAQDASGKTSEDNQDLKNQDRKRAGPRQQDRSERIPLGTMRTKLNVRPIEGYHLHWVNDVGDRIEQAKAGWYEHVSYDELAGRTIGDYNVAPDSQDMGANVSKLVGTLENGNPEYSFLMKIKKEYYDEDQAAKMQTIKALEDGVLNLEGKGGLFYTDHKEVREHIGR